MPLNSKVKKRILIFIIVPVLTALPFFTDDFIIKIICAALTVIYVGFIIFLRDSVRDEVPISKSSPIKEKEFDDLSSGKMEPGLVNDHNYETDFGEEFKIISKEKNLEVITAENFTPSLNSGKKNAFKPPDLKENYLTIAKEPIPQDLSSNQQFVFLLEKILNVIKEAYVAHTAVFFWYKEDSKKLLLEKFVSRSEEITQRKFDLEDDVLSNIVKTQEPEILSVTPNAEADVIRYYNNPQGIKSFVGVPLFYGNRLRGILALDSKEQDYFGIEHIYSLGRFVRIISILISIFDDRHSESISEKRLTALLNVLSQDRTFDKEHEIISVLESSIKELVDWDVFTFVYFDAEKEKFKTLKVFNKTSLKYVGENLEVELKGTIIGQSIMTGTPVKIDDTSEAEYHRFSFSEDITFDGSFLAVPLLYNEQIFGVLCFESLKKNYYSNSDVKFIKNAVKVFAFIVYTFSTQNVLKSFISYDMETNTLNPKSFIERFNSDLLKAEQLESKPGAVALIRIDDFLEQESLFEGDPFPKVLTSINEMIKEELTPFTIIGRIEKRIFAVYFFNTQSKDVFLWAEKLRIKIARKPIAVVSKQTTFTVSIGVASTTGKTNAEELLHDAELALNKALEKGGNTVKSIN
jgi:diguanylate cyclase (GGDEF)-like protein